MLRTRRWLQEGDGRLFDLGEDGSGQPRLVESPGDDPEARTASAKLAKLLEGLPGTDGHPGLKRPKPGDPEEAPLD